ncbi:MAG: tetratricopeptide repeat protein [Bacteroidota bacterium]
MNALRVVMVLIAWSVLPAVSFAQSGTADEAWVNKRYQDAADLYLQTYRKDTNNVQAIQRMAEANRMLRNFAESEGWYTVFADKKPLNAEQALAFAQVLAHNKKYKSSRFWYGKFADLNPSDPRGELFEAAYLDMKPFYKDSLQWKLYYLSLNSEADEYAPMIMDTALFFTSNRIKSVFMKGVSAMTREPFTDVYVIGDRNEIVQIRANQSTDTTDVSGKRNRVNQGFAGSDNNTLYTFSNRFIASESPYFTEDSEIKKLPKVFNTKAHDGNTTFDPASGMLYLNTSQTASGDTTRIKGAYYDYQKLRIVGIRQKDGVWEERQNFPFNSKMYSTAHPALSEDGQVLYFISDMPGGYGGTDIYYCLKDGNYWTTPVNMGPLVNTVANEVFPFEIKGKLYFSTTGWPGLGGLDLFVAPLSNHQPEKQPVNLGYPLNSSSDDFGIVFEKDGASGGYFSSNRLGSDDIYRFEK